MAFRHSLASLDRERCLREAEGFPFGVNVIGYLHAESGVGEAARSSVRALRAAGIPVSLIDFRTGHPARMGEDLPDGLSNGERYAVNLVHVNADEVPTVFLELGRPCFQRHRNIGFWNWELPRLPERWAAHARVFHEIWTPSAFVQRAVECAIREVPIRNVPFCVRAPCAGQRSRRDLGLPGKGFLFLAAMDFLSVMERKNPVAVLDAFERAFPTGDEAAFLVVKVNNPGAGSGTLSDMTARLRRNPRMITIERAMDRPEWDALLAHSDAVVSLHHSEGFGLILAEAMAAGKPVIATGWSGNMEFMNERNAFPLRYRLVRVGKTVGPYDAGQDWADPDVDHAAQIMRDLSTQPVLATEIGSVARSDLRQRFSALTVGTRMKDLLTGSG